MLEKKLCAFAAKREEGSEKKVEQTSSQKRENGVEWIWRKMERGRGKNRKSRLLLWRNETNPTEEVPISPIPAAEQTDLPFVKKRKRKERKICFCCSAGKKRIPVTVEEEKRPLLSSHKR